MPEKPSDDALEDTQDQQAASLSLDEAQPPEHRGCLAAIIIVLIVLLLLFLISIVSASIPTILILVTIILAIVSIVLSQSTPMRLVWEAVRRLHEYLDRCIQGITRVINEKGWMLSTAILCLILASLLCSLYLPHISSFLSPPIVSKPSPIAATPPISVIQASDGSYVGISSGLTNFDTNRVDSHLKDEAAQSLKENDTNAAKGYWQLAIREDESDAEACIYLENQNVLDSSSNDYVTIVVVATLTGNDQHAIDVGRSILQGAYVAQKEYNSQQKLPDHLFVRLLIANIDDPSLYTDNIVEQIKEAVTNDTTTIVGVMGQLSNSDSAIQALSDANIPMISSTTLYSAVETPYLFSVAPSIQREAEVAAQAAIKYSRNAILLYDSDNTYSVSLAQAFKTQFEQLNGHALVDTYSIGQASDTFPRRISGAMSSVPQPGLVYLAGYPNDASVLAPYIHSRWSNVQVMGGDALSQYVHAYSTPAEQLQFNGLLFTSFAFQDEWHGHIPQRPAFFNEYALDFDAQKQHAGNPYGYLLPDSDTILSYDATNVFLRACSDVLTKKLVSLTPKTLWQDIKSTPSFNGVSGRITFGNDGEPINKAVVIMEVKPVEAALLDIQGSYP